LTAHDIATVLENGNGEIEQLKYSDSDAEAIFARGVDVGSRLHTGRALSADFFDDDATPRWAEMVSFCHGCPAKAGLRPAEQEFIDDMSAKLRWRTPSRAQGGFLLSIFWKLRGSLN